MPQEPLDQFIENLLQQSGLGNLPADYKAVYVEKLKEQINRRLSLMLMENLNEESTKELAGVLADPKNFNLAQMQNVFMNHIPDFEKKVGAEMVAFAQDFVKASQVK